MTDLIQPNLHPIFVHFVVGLLFTSMVALAAAAFAPGEPRWRGALQTAGDWMLGFGLLAVVGAVIAGLDAYYSVAHDEPSHAAMTTHRNWALATATVFVGLGVWRWVTRRTRPGALFGLAGLAAAGLLTVTAWWGGELVFQYGLGVESLPAATGEGHDHDHGDGGHGSDEDAHHDEVDDAHGEAGHHDEAGDGATPATAAPGSPEAAAQAFRTALADSDESAVRALLAEEVLILESGGAERSLEEYASHHMTSDMAFLSSVESETLSQRSEVFGDTAWIATETALRGTYDGREIAVKSQESLVLRRNGEGWVIEHVHWSNSPLPDETAEPDSDETGEHDHDEHEH